MRNSHDFILHEREYIKNLFFSCFSLLLLYCFCLLICLLGIFVFYVLLLHLLYLLAEKLRRNIFSVVRLRIPH